MLKLPEKLRIYKAKTKVRNVDIALALGVSVQTVSNWINEKYCPKKLTEASAAGLMAFTNGYITKKDCGV